MIDHASSCTLETNIHKNSLSFPPVPYLCWIGLKGVDQPLYPMSVRTSFGSVRGPSKGPFRRLSTPPETMLPKSSGFDAKCWRIQGRKWQNQNIFFNLSFSVRILTIAAFQMLTRLPAVHHFWWNIEFQSCFTWNIEHCTVPPRDICSSLSQIFQF